MGSFNLGFKTLRLVSIFIAIVGLLFIFAANSIGVFSIRLIAFIVIGISLINLNLSMGFSFTWTRFYFVLGVIGGILVLIFPWLAMFFIGIGLVVFTVPNIYNIIKDRDFSDRVSFISYTVALLFGIYCIINGYSAMSSIIKLIGIIMLIGGSFFFYKSIDLERKSNSFVNDINNGIDEYRFNFADEVEEEN